jgi:prophage maintenance system killer protein
LNAAAQLGFGIANAQAFLDGNRRTARAVTQTFLANNGLGHLSPVDKEDHTLARLLNRVVTPAGADRATLDDFAELFRRRWRHRKPRV